MGSSSGFEVRISSVKVETPLTVRFLAGYRGILSHWYSHRGRACKGRGACPQEWHKVPPIWYGFAPVERWEPVLRKWIPTVLEITASLEHSLRGRELRGEMWALLRKVGKKDRGEVIGTYLETLPKVRPAFDVFPVLEIAYGYGDFLIDLPNPVPPPLILEASDDPGPSVPDNLKPVQDHNGAEAGEMLKDYLKQRGIHAPSTNGKHG
jgi:hypothetical protein